MANQIVALERQLREARERHLAFHEQHDDPLEIGTPEFEKALALGREVDRLLEEMASSEPESIEDARALAAAALAHCDAPDEQPVHRMIERIYRFLDGPAQQFLG